MIIYRGPSMIDGTPIVMIAVGFAGSRNEKTGAGLVQTYILRDNINPVAAARTGADHGICGDCKHRGTFKDGLRVAGSRLCYVNLGQGVTIVHKSLSKGVYAEVEPDAVADTFAGHGIRMGTYGDPAAVPAWVWHAANERAGMRTGYTHQWRDARFQYLRAYTMASVDSEEEAFAARAMGWRTFRVGHAVNWTKLPGEGLCPASHEAGKATTCDACGLCSGVEGKGRGSIVIPDHSVSGNALKRAAGILPPIKRNPSVRVTVSA